MEKIIYKDLSYEVVGILFQTFEELGYGYHERTYEKAIENLLVLHDLNYKRQIPYNLKFAGADLKRMYFDFLIENKIVLELKVGNRFLKNNLYQIKEYLKISGKQLGILANFTSQGVKFYRVLNINDSISGK